jgi:hypothetical protein
MNGDIEHRDLVARLRVANERMRQLREDAESADNEIRFRVERHLEAAEETLRDLNVRVTDVPAAGSHGRRRLKRGLCRVEAEIVFAEAKLEAARAEESDDMRTYVRVTRRAMSAQRAALLAEIASDPHEPASAG